MWLTDFTLSHSGAILEKYHKDTLKNIYKIRSYTIFNLVKYRSLQVISTFFALFLIRELLEKTEFIFLKLGLII